MTPKNKNKNVETNKQTKTLSGKTGDKQIYIYILFGSQENKKRTLKVEAVGTKRAVKVPQTKAAEVTPDRTPNADARLPSEILSACSNKFKFNYLFYFKLIIFFSRLFTLILAILLILITQNDQNI